MTRRSYSATAVPTTLQTTIGPTDTSMVIVDITGWPDGTGGPFTVTMKRGQSGEEKILATTRSGTTVSGMTRGYEGTTAVTHQGGESVEHTLSKTDLDEANAHINATSGAHAASAISNTPAGNIAATTVQAAINELDTEKLDATQADALFLTPAEGNAAYVAQTLVDAKGDLLAATADNTVARVAVGANDTVLTADSTQAAGVKWAAVASAPSFARKTADQTVTSSTVLVNDTHLLIALTANGVWTFKAFLIVSGDTAGDIRLAFTVPAGSTLRWGAAPGLNAASATSAGTNDLNANMVNTSGTIENYAVFVGASIIVVEGIVRTAGTAGNLQLQWTQNASSATATTVAQESFLQAQKVA